MRNNRKTEIRVGIISVISILLIIWIFGWAKNIHPFEEKLNFGIEFNSVAGLESGDPVAINGVKKGSVTSINTTSNGVLVEVELEKDAKIQDDAKYSIMMLDLMGGKIVEIDPGKSGNAADLTKIQSGRFSGDISTAMAALSSVQDDLIDLVYQLKTSINGINSILGDKALMADMKSAFQEVNSSVKVMKQILDENREGIKNLVNSGNQLLNQGNEIISENREPISNSLTKLNKVLNSSDSLMKKLNIFSDEIAGRKNNIGKIIYDENMVDELKNSLMQINKLTKILIDQLEKDGINVDANVDLF